MISNPTLYRQARRLLGWALALSLLVHFAGVLVWGIVSGELKWLRPQPARERYVILSTSTLLLHHAVPQPPRQHPVRAEAPSSAHRASVPQRVVVAPVPRVPRVPRELTYTAPSAPPKPIERKVAAPRPRAATTFAQRLARDQQVFRREIAHLQAQNNPLSVATIAPRPPSSYRRAYVNVSGVDRALEHYEGVVTPTRTWTDGNLRCHYASYDVEYSTGASDRGDIPWPLCYPPQSDPMMLPDGRPVPNGSPVAAVDLFPMQGYALPPGTYLTQFLRMLYRRQL